MIWIKLFFKCVWVLFVMYFCLIRELCDVDYVNRFLIFIVVELNVWFGVFVIYKGYIVGWFGFGSFIECDMNFFLLR